MILTEKLNIMRGIVLYKCVFLVILKAYLDIKSKKTNIKTKLLALPHFT